MSSIFFQFYYDDGSIRPFDADVAASMDLSQFEVAPVVTDGLIDIFELSPEELQEKGLTDAAFRPSFIKDYTEIAEDDGEGLDGLGIHQNVYCESATILVNPKQLKEWAENWLQTLQSMDEQERKEILVFSSNYTGEIFKALGEIVKQAECALAHSVGIMLFIAW